MRRYVTTGDGQRTFAEEPLRWRHDDTSEGRQIVLYPEAHRQRVIGFGGALTEASAWVFAQMPAALQDEVLIRCFGPASHGGNDYTLCRTHLQSCDFARDNYAYVTRPRRGQDVLDTFTIEHDRGLLIPFIRCCRALAPELSLVAAPWSPPAFMKTNRSMNHGGKLRARYADAWARVLARTVAAWRAEGAPIERLAVQNEPMATQTWDSCVYTAQEEACFAARHLKPALAVEGLDDVKLLVWDHTTERLVSRMSDIDAVLTADGGLPATFAGAAFHWYTGDHFDAVRLARTLYPDCELIHTEGCAAFSDGKGEHTATDAEHYAHDMIGDLNAGANGYIDWNILLDEQGGPNHVGNYCDAPLMYDRASERLIVNRSFYYIGHITRFVQPGARIVPTSSYTDRLETLGALNVDGTHALVILNRGTRDRAAIVRHGDRTARVTAPAHSIQTLVW